MISSNRSIKALIASDATSLGTFSGWEVLTVVKRDVLGDWYVNSLSPHLFVTMLFDGDDDVFAATGFEIVVFVLVLVLVEVEEHEEIDEQQTTESESESAQLELVVEATEHLLDLFLPSSETLEEWLVLLLLRWRLLFGFNSIMIPSGEVANKASRRIEGWAPVSASSRISRRPKRSPGRISIAEGEVSMLISLL